MQSKFIITVSQLNCYIKSAFECDKNLKNIFISGEVSNFKGNYQSGHLYFSLKEGNSSIRAIMFAANAKKLRFDLKDGMNIIVRGNVLCYEVSGQYQIYVEDIQPCGIGAYYLELEQLKEKLAGEGLFLEEKKKNLPRYPKRIGVVTSLSGAAVKDIENVLKRRYPIAEVSVYPALVQGKGSAEKIIEIINRISKSKEVDVIIIGRGGGSAEELWEFNNEALARSVFNSEVPIISAVGHETDFTICDFVSDKRAPTPSAAAELCVPDLRDVANEIKGFRKQINALYSQKIRNFRGILSEEAKRVQNTFSARNIEGYKNQVLGMKNDLSFIMRRRVSDKKIEAGVLLNKLNVLNPEAIMKKGYIVMTDGDGIINEKNRISENKKVRIKFLDGEIECKITDIRSIKG